MVLLIKKYPAGRAFQGHNMGGVALKQLDFKV